MGTALEGEEGENLDAVGGGGGGSVEQNALGRVQKLLGCFYLCIGL